MKVLITGGSGYLGQFIVKELTKNEGNQILYTYHSHSPTKEDLLNLGNPTALKVDLVTGEGLSKCLEALGTPDVVVNCAAISVLGECERDPQLAESLNMPLALLDWLDSFDYQNAPLLIHLSTDQVYEGTKSFYTEKDESKPVNVYGQTKLKAEILIQLRWENHIILRSSIIVGPNPPLPLKKALPLQRIQEILFSQTPTEFFFDEFRCPIFVYDIIDAINQIIKFKSSKNHFPCRLFNFGGPDRVSRADMAKTAAKVLKYDINLVKETSTKSIDRGFRSPVDISMDSNLLVSTFDLNLTKFEDAVKQIFEK